MYVCMYVCVCVFVHEYVCVCACEVFLRAVVNPSFILGIRCFTFIVNDRHRGSSQRYSCVWV